MIKEAEEFIKISKYAGERFDIVQAGGGNSSVKLEDGTMLIKASGFYLSDVEENYAYAQVKNEKLLEIFTDKEILEEKDKTKRDLIFAKKVAQSNITEKFRPSIETLLHSILKKFVLHTHPIVVNGITCRSGWREDLETIFSCEFKNGEVVFVDYKTPGFELALELKESISRLKNIPSVIFLQNHGVIVTAESAEEIINLNEKILLKIEEYLEVDMSKYKLTTEVSRIINEVENTNKIAYLSCDEFLNSILKNKSDIIFTLAFCPDTIVYCGAKTMVLWEKDGLEQILEYKNKYFECPKVLIYKDKLFFIANNLRKAREIEDVFKFHVMSLSFCDNQEVNFLSENEFEYIGNWEAEKYRQNFQKNLIGI